VQKGNTKDGSSSALTETNRKPGAFEWVNILEVYTRKTNDYGVFARICCSKSSKAIRGGITKSYFRVYCNFSVTHTVICALCMCLFSLGVCKYYIICNTCGESINRDFVLSLSEVPTVLQAPLEVYTHDHYSNPQRICICILLLLLYHRLRHHESPRKGSVGRVLYLYYLLIYMRETFVPYNIS